MHAGPRDRLADRRCIGHVVLLPFHIGLHIGGRDQPNVMTERKDFPRPVMRGAAGFHAHKTARQTGHELQHLVAPQPLTKNDPASGIGAVQLKYRLGQINPECCNLHVDGSRSCVGR